MYNIGNSYESLFCLDLLGVLRFFLRIFVEPVTGIEPVTPDYKSGALPTKLYRHKEISNFFKYMNY